MSRIGPFNFVLVVLATWIAAAPTVPAQTLDTPMTRLRPIGSPSAVDKYRQAAAPRLEETNYQIQTVQATGQPVVRQAAWMQQEFQAPQLPQNGNGFALPSTGVNGGAVGNQPPVNVPATPPRTPSTPPRTLPSGPAATLQPVPNGSVPSASDLSVVPQPQLDGGFATIDNCSCISPPSQYRAVSAYGCGAPIGYDTSQVYVPPPAQVAGPAIMPGGFFNPSAEAAPIGPLVSFGQQLNPVQVGQGIIGQPVAYVPGQPVRNFLRYLFP